MSQPLFSIGVTTYNRPDLLRQCLQAILAQTEGDFEVVVGNDYIAEPLTTERLGLSDPRIRILNYETNLGELGNMNALLAAARGRYFTWLADDDYYSPHFLADIHAAMRQFPDAATFFPAYANVRFYGRNSVRLLFRDFPPVPPRLLTGREFLAEYWRGRIKTCGLWGVYRTEHMRTLGGAANLTNTRIAIMSESMDLIYAGLQPRVVYLARPLIYSRAHLGSWSCSNTEADNFRFAGTNLLRKSIDVFQHDTLRKDFEGNLTALLQQMILLIVAKTSARPGGDYSRRMMQSYLQALEGAGLPLVDPVLRAPAERSFDAARSYLNKIAPVFAILSRVPAGLRPFLNRMHGKVKGEITD